MKTITKERPVKGGTDRGYTDYTYRGFNIVIRKIRSKGNRYELPHTATYFWLNDEDDSIDGGIKEAVKVIDERLTP